MSEEPIVLQESRLYALVRRRNLPHGIVYVPFLPDFRFDEQRLRELDTENPLLPNCGRCRVGHEVEPADPDLACLVSRHEFDVLTRRAATSFEDELRIVTFGDLDAVMRRMRSRMADARSAARLGAADRVTGYLDRDPERRAQSFRHAHPEAAAEASAAWSRLLALRQRQARAAERAREVTMLAQPMFEEWE